MVSIRQAHQQHPAASDNDWLTALALSSNRHQAMQQVFAWQQQLATPWLDAVRLKGQEMVEILAQLNMDEDTLLSAYLFPAFDEECVDKEQIAETFGQTVALMLDGAKKMDAIRTIDHVNKASHQQVDNLRRMLLAMVEDVRAVVVKLAERVCHLHRIKQQNEETRVLAAKEAMNVYAPLANRLGIGQLKWELEDMAFRYLHPDTYKSIAKQLEEKRVDREAYMVNFVTSLQHKLDAEGINGEVYGRPKHIYSIYKKMQKKNYAFSELFDIRAVRVVVDKLQDCYAALGIVHTSWRHLPKEFDDYIATPKPNGYQSIHTVVYGPEGKTVEVQIRTQQMDEDAELGVAAHWKYKEGALPGRGSGYEQKINWLRRLLQWQEDVVDDNSLAGELANQVFEDRVYVFSPKGDIYDLPQGATPLDFAYHIHSNIGHRCIGAKVFGRIVPFTYQLQTGDQIEILTSKYPNPSRDWLNPNLGYVHSSRARAKIHSWFKLQDRDKNLQAGRELLETELSRLELSIKDADPAVKRFNVNSLDELLVAVGAGDIKLLQVVNFLQALHKPEPEPETPVFRKSQVAHKPARNGVLVEGVGNLMTHMAGCCEPVPGDSIVGYITQSRGIAIHRGECEQLKHLQDVHPERVVEANWAEQVNGGFAMTIRVVAHDRAGLIRDVCSILANEKSNILNMNVQTDSKQSLAVLDMKVEINDLTKMQRILAKIAQLEDIIEAKRSH